MNKVLLTKIKSAHNIAVITLSDENQLNAMGEEMAQDFRDCIVSLNNEKDSLRAIILTGAGKAFSAGGDLEMLLSKTKLSGEENRQKMFWFYESFLSILNLQVPIISAINGAAVGAGMCVACAGDIRIASDKAKIGFAFTRLGLHPGMGATYSIPKITSTAIAAELLLTGRIIEASEALRLGLVSKITTAEDLIPEAINIAKSIAENGKEATKQLILSIRNPPSSLADALTKEATTQSINYGSKEFLDGVMAVKNRKL